MWYKRYSLWKPKSRYNLIECYTVAFWACYPFFHDFKKSGNLAFNVAATASLLDHLGILFYVLLKAFLQNTCRVARAKVKVPYLLRTRNWAQCSRLLRHRTQRPVSATEAQPYCSLLDIPQWLYYFNLIFDHEVTCQPLFCRETVFM